MKQDKKWEKTHEKEKNLKLMEDLSVAGALVILLLALFFLIDAARYQWVLVMILILGVLLNLNLAVCGLVRQKWYQWVFSFLMILVLLGALVYFGIKRWMLL